MISRRLCLSASAAASFWTALPHAAVAGGPVNQSAQRDWDHFRARFIAAEGRVVDTGNGNCSHSEGQGYGMLLAVAHNDQPSFDLLLDWTCRNLRQANSSLHSWRYLPNAANPVPDKNNATDGDLLIALAMARAGRKWGRFDNLQAAGTMAHDILRLLVRRTATRTVLLPGAFGFEHREGLVINPSYYVFTAFTELAPLAPSPVWDALRDDGLQMIGNGRFGRWNLPPDWLFISHADGGMAPAAGWPPRFSYDAIRVPLYLAWAGLRAGDLDTSLANFWKQRPSAPPAWVDLNTNETAKYSLSAGQQAVATLAIQRSEGKLGGSAPNLPDVSVASDYYAAALLMLTKLAWRESQIV